MRAIIIESPHDVMRKVAQRARQRRLHENLTQQGLAERAGVSLGTLKLFERSGKAALETVVLIAFALGSEKEFSCLFPPAPPRSIDEVVDKPARQRGRRT